MGKGPDTQTVSRRRFLATAGATAAAVGAPGAFPHPSRAAHGKPTATMATGIPPERISIQLFTLRDQLAIDLPGHS